MLLQDEGVDVEVLLMHLLQDHGLKTFLLALQVQAWVLVDHILIGKNLAGLQGHILDKWDLVLDLQDLLVPLALLVPQALLVLVCLLIICKVPDHNLEEIEEILVLVIHNGHSNIQNPLIKVVDHSHTTVIVTGSSTEVN
jgi:hypothetical protein